MNSQQRTERQRWMAVLARATADELVAVLAETWPAVLRAPLPYERLKGPETGTVMIEARAGGTGRRFNQGEATVSRAIVRLADGTVGASYALGSDRRKAEAAALIDAGLQRGDKTAAALLAHIDLLAEGQAAAKARTADSVARTKVEFFTVTRGHD